MKKVLEKALKQAELVEVVPGAIELTLDKLDEAIDAAVDETRVEDLVDENEGALFECGQTHKMRGLLTQRQLGHRLVLVELVEHVHELERPVTRGKLEIAPV